jgi:hypothetical protein
MAGPLREWSLEAAAPEDAAWMAELRAVVMRPDLERLGRWDPVRVRQRFLTAYAPEHTSVLQGSAARRLYERHGFELESEDPVDVYLISRPGA